MIEIMIEEEILADISLIDTHAHRIHPDRAPDLSQVNCYAQGKGQEIHSRETVLYHTVIERLRAEWKLPAGMSTAEVEQERDRRYQADPARYFRDMAESGNVAMYCMEVGSPLFGAAYTPEEIAYFNASVPENKQCQIVRIERVVDELLDQKLPFIEFLEAFDREFTTLLKQERTVGIKSCIAYYGGLDIGFYTGKQAAAAYEKMREGKAGPEERTCLYQFFLWHGTEYAAEYDLPIQIHTGQGAGQYIDYRTMNPIYLVPYLSDARVREKVKVVLLHGGHPHEEDTGNLVLQFPNVYTDFSGVVWFGAANSQARLRALTERAPLDKIMYGSDATMIPELYWYSPHQFRRLLAELLNALITERYMTEERALDVAEMILRTNALNCYAGIKKLL